MNIFPSGRSYIDRGLYGDTISIKTQQASNDLRESLQLLLMLMLLFVMMMMMIIMMQKKKKKKKKKKK